MSHIQSSLIKKYNVAGPRYTSYPTVPYWDTSPTEAQWIEALSENLEKAEKESIGAALYVHIPFCESLCTYCGCNTRITRNHGVGLPYVDVVLKEWSLYLEKLGRSRIPLSELHLGGGTPTFLSSTELARLVDGLLKHADVQKDSEFSIEVDPRVTNEEQLQVLKSLGFRRISLGVQDFDPKVQEVVHRIQSEEQVRQVTERARSAGFESVNFDLIYGLPFQTLKSIENTMEVVARLRPDRIAFYGYAHVPWIKPSHRRFTEADLPSGDEKRALYELGRAILEKEGYHEIGMDHFALKSDSLWKATEGRSLHRNFMGYTSRKLTPLFGLGVSAIGDAWTAFAQNEKLLETYIDRVQKGEIPIHRGHLLNDEDLKLRRHILNLMTEFSTDWRSADLQTDYLKSVSARLAELSKDGLVSLKIERCEVTPLGHAFIRNICMAFDARLTRKAPDTELFSKTV